MNRRLSTLLILVISMVASACGNATWGQNAIGVTGVTPAIPEAECNQLRTEATTLDSVFVGGDDTKFADMFYRAVIKQDTIINIQRLVITQGF